MPIVLEFHMIGDLYFIEFCSVFGGLHSNCLESCFRSGPFINLR